MKNYNEYKQKVHEEFLEEFAFGAGFRSDVSPSFAINFLDTALDNLLVEVEKRYGHFSNGCDDCTEGDVEELTQALTRFKGEEV